jgi:hypothetical protein
MGLLMPSVSFVSSMTQGGSIYGLPGWGPPLVLTFPEAAFLPAMLLGCLALCRAAVLGLPVAAGLGRGVRQAAPYAATLLVLLFLASSIAASRANVEATRQMELAVTDPLGAMEGTDDRQLVELVRVRPDTRHAFPRRREPRHRCGPSLGCQHLPTPTRAPT